MINLGSAANYAGLELGASLFTISKVTTTITGNIGLPANGSLDFSGGGTISGSIDAGAGASLAISGGSTAHGGIDQPDAAVAQAVADAKSAANYYSGLTPAATLSSVSGGSYSGSGGLHVYDVTGDMSLSRTNLTLTGTSSDLFVFNIDGVLNLQGGSNIVLVGLNANQVLFNLIGTGAKMTTSGDADTAGIFLAQQGSINIAGGVHNSDFIAGGTIVWQSGVQITQATSLAIQPVPEQGTGLMAAGSAGLVLLLAAAKSRGARPTAGR
jgi:hypothetical protein